MFGDINEVRVMGNITADVECRFTPKGTPVLNFSIATNRSYKQDDEWKEEVTFHNVTLWRNADSVVKRIQKGTRIYVEGRLTTRSWESNGEKRYRTEILADRVILINKLKDIGESDPGPSDDDNKEHFDNTELVENGGI